jgi:ribosomal protein L11 methyltransferase
MTNLVLKAQIFSLFNGRVSGFTAREVEKEVRRHQPEASRRQIRAAITGLVAEGRLHYTHRYGLSQLERSYTQLRRISDRIWLAPVEYDQSPPPGAVVIKLAAGASFGGGDHPTTRLALQALELAVARLSCLTDISGCAALDIGTGSGVLALAAVALGIKSAIALDLDPVACHEATANVHNNGFMNQVTVSDQPLPDIIHPPFELVLANLRPPTLRVLFGPMRRFTSGKGLWVLSGFRPAEMPSLRNHAEAAGRVVLWESILDDWGAWLIQCAPSQ